MGDAERPSSLASGCCTDLVFSEFGKWWINCICQLQSNPFEYSEGHSSYLHHQLWHISFCRHCYVFNDWTQVGTFPSDDNWVILFRCQVYKHELICKIYCCKITPSDLHMPWCSFSQEIIQILLKASWYARYSICNVIIANTFPLPEIVFLKFPFLIIKLTKSSLRSN